MNITSDSTVVDMVKGCTLEFATYPHHPCQPKEINFSSRECLAIKIELQRLLDKGIIIPSEHETCEFISTIFVRPKAKENVTDTVNIFQDLGFTIHPEKSILVPTRTLTFLGFILDSHFMRISLTAGKADSLKAAAQALHLRKSPTIREVAEVIGKMVASFPGVQLGPLYYRQLENDKIKALRENYGNFDTPMVISGTARADLKWWINNIQTSYNPFMWPLQLWS